MEKLQKYSAKDGRTTKIMAGTFYKKIFIGNNICFSIFKPGFIEDLFTTLIDKTRPFISIKRDDYLTKAFETLTPHGLSIEESV